MSTGLQDRT